METPMKGLKFYYSEKFNEFMVTSWNGNGRRKWVDTLIVLPCLSSSIGPEYPCRRFIPWHYKRVWEPDQKLIRIANDWESKGKE